jgi:mono/diheme cytochrome c family protein
MPTLVRLLLVASVMLTGCSSEGTIETANPVLAGTGEVASGEELFAANCAACHGVDARGSDQGPSFLNDTYVPSHHADGAFLIAVRTGVQPHHWNFGPMPPRPGLSDQDVADIVAYVRAQQRYEGLIE